MSKKKFQAHNRVTHRENTMPKFTVSFQDTTHGETHFGVIADNERLAVEFAKNQCEIFHDYRPDGEAKVERQ